jgi:hypothetical protein
MSKKKVKPLLHKNNQEINKKAIVWTGSIVTGIIIVMAVLLIVNQ